MSKYVLRRVLIAIPTFFVITFVVFALYTLAPGDPLVAYVGDEAIYWMSEEQIAQVREQYHLDEPFYVRYGDWLWRALHGDLGYPTKGNATVVENLRVRLGPTLLLMGTSLLLAVMTGIPMGVLMAMRQYSVLDYVLTIIAFANLSIPAFFAALGFIYIFSLKLDILPTYGMASVGEPFSLWDRVRHLIMPATILGLMRSGQWARYTRSSMLEVMHSDYVRTARAKGLREATVMTRHIFRNALLPLVTMIGLSLPALLGGAVIIETVFQWPGMGMLGYRATVTRDYPMLMGILLVSTGMILASNLITDMAYRLVDPRIRYE